MDGIRFINSRYIQNYLRKIDYHVEEYVKSKYEED